MRIWFVGIIFLVFLFCAKAVTGQEIGSDQPLKDQWIADWAPRFKTYQTDRAKFFYRYEQRYWLLRSFIEQDRRVKTKPPKFHSLFVPPPPPFLYNICVTTQPKDSFYYEPCLLLREYRDDLSTRLIRNQIQAQTVFKEEPKNSSFAKRIHIDGGWNAARFPSPHIYGVIGLHIGLLQFGRTQLYVLPGGMIIAFPDGRGGRSFRPAATSGASIRLFDFKPFWSAHKNGLHLNTSLVRIIGLSTGDNFVFEGSNLLPMVGFSITPFGKD